MCSSFFSSSPYSSSCYSPFFFILSCFRYLYRVILIGQTYILCAIQFDCMHSQTPQIEFNWTPAQRTNGESHAFIMIGSSNYVENIQPPTIIISDEALNNNIHNRPTLTLYSDEPNNNYQVIDSPAPIEYCSHDDQINGNFLCLSNNVINLDDIPISALRTKGRDILSKRLNAIKVILSENGAPRDWRGVLNSIGSSDAVNAVQQKSDEMKEVLDLWMNTRKASATLGNLQRILGNIDRWDVVDDTYDYFGKFIYRSIEWPHVRTEQFITFLNKQLEKRFTLKHTHFAIHSWGRKIVFGHNGEAEGKQKWR